MQNNQTEQNSLIQQPKKTIQNHYSYDEVITWLEKKGVELYGNHFKILETDYPIVYKLIAYFLKDEPYMFSIRNKFQQRFDIKRRTASGSQVQK